MKNQRSSYPFRMEPEVRKEAEELAVKQDRSLNWELNQLVKIGLAQVKAGQHGSQSAAR